MGLIIFCDSQLMQDIAITPQSVYLDGGYGLKKESRLPMLTLLLDMKRQMTGEARKLATWGQAIKTIIGQLKSAYRPNSCYLKGQLGDAIHGVLSVATYNTKWLMRVVLRKGIKRFLGPYFARELQALFENPKQIPARFLTKPINQYPRIA